MTDYPVTTTDDVVAGSLRQAIINANANPGSDTISFDNSLDGLTINLSLGELQITDSVSINGDIDNDGVPDITVDAGGNSRVFHINDGTSTQHDIALDGLIISGGLGGLPGGGGILSYENLSLTGSTVSGNSTTVYDSPGGGIYIYGATLTLNNALITGNATTGGRSDGGGIAVEDSSLILTNTIVSANSTEGEEADGGGIFADDSILTLVNATVSGNTTTAYESDGGGIALRESLVTITASTISANSTAGAYSEGGGIFVREANLVISDSTISANAVTGGVSSGGGIFSDTDLAGYSTTVINSTISGNSTTLGYGGGIANLDGLLQLSNSTITANTAPAAQGGGLASYGDSYTSSIVTSSLISANASSDVDFISFIEPAAIISNGFNLLGSGDALVSFTQSTDITGVSNPGLADLADNGGPTFTHALLATSPAIDAGSNPEALVNDQRGTGFSRQLGLATDIGAFEAATLTAPPIAIPTLQSGSLIVLALLLGGAVALSRRSGAIEPSR